MKLIKNIKKSVNSNLEIISKGKWVNLKFILGVDDKDFIFKINCGKIVSIEKRTVDTKTGLFKISSSLTCWEKHWLHTPPRDYHDLFAMLSKKIVKIDGNILPLMQNLQFFKDLIASNRKKKDDE
tara:strand:+ start:91 stop:465 length:375 start_codon:yes stop_codon:yes gene_type:complete